MNNPQPTAGCLRTNYRYCKPLTRNDSLLEYLLSQYITEFIKAEATRAMSTQVHLGSVETILPSMMKLGLTAKVLIIVEMLKILHKTSPLFTD